jgi:PAS domain S-box-containing protein
MPDQETGSNLMDGRSETSGPAKPGRGAAAEGSVFRERFFDSSFDMLAVATIDGALVDVNGAWTRWLGWAAPDLVGRPYVSLFHPEDAARAEDTVARMRAGQEVLEEETRLLAPDGTHRWVLIGAEPDLDAGVFYVTVRDNEARRAAEAALRGAEERLRSQLGLEAFVTFFSTRFLGARADELEDTIYDALAGLSAIFGLDHAYVLKVGDDITSMEAFVEWWGEGVSKDSIPIAELPPAAGRFWLSKLAFGEVVHLPTLDIVPEYGEAAVAALASTGVKSILFLPLRSRDRTVGFFGFEARRVPVEWSPEEIGLMRTVGELFVITIDRARAVAAMEAAVAELAERNEDLERSNRDLEHFATIASHDLKSPLPVMRGFVELLARAATDAASGQASVTPEQIETYAAAALRGVQRMNTLIDDVLAYAQAGRGPGERRPVDLTVLARTVVAEVDAGPEAAIHVGALPTVDGDRTQLGQLLQNLVANAVKFSRPDRAPVVSVSAERADDEWWIVVADGGIGIDPADRDRVFQMFTRLAGPTPVPGSGIGLAVCARVVENHGGRIWVEDNPGGGSRFVVALPA